MNKELLKFPTGIHEHYHIGWIGEPFGVEIQHWKAGWLVVDSWCLIGGEPDNEEIERFDTFEEAVAFIKEEVRKEYGTVEFFDVPIPITKNDDGGERE